MRVFTPEGAMALAFQRQQENRELYQGMGIGAITPPAGKPLLGPASVQLLPSTPMTAPVTSEVTAYPSAAAPQPGNDADDIPEFDTF